GGGRNAPALSPTNASFLLPILPADDRSGSFTSFPPLPRVRLVPSADIRPMPALISTRLNATARIPPAGRRRPAGPGVDQDRRAAAKRRPPPPSFVVVGARRGWGRANCA